MTTYNTCCCDCGLDTVVADEWYMVEDAIWEQAWGHISRGTPGEQILCIGCLERRIGRVLTADDFPDVPVNGACERFMSERLFYRVTGL